MERKEVDEAKIKMMEEVAMKEVEDGEGRKSIADRR